MRGRIIRPENKAIKTVLPVVGKVRVGEKKKNQNGKEYPVSVDYFVATGQYSTLFNKVYPKSSKIEIVFLHDELELSCAEEWQYRDDSGRLFARGDGNNFDVWNKEKELYVPVSMKDLNVIDTVAAKCPSKSGWQVMLTMRFLIPRITGIAGLWEFQTKGDKSTIPNITSSFDSVLENRGFVKGIIFDLSVKFATSNKPGITRKYPVVSLVANMSEENQQAIKQSIMKIENPLKAIEQ